MIKYIYIFIINVFFFYNIFYEYAFFQNSAHGRQTKLEAQGPSHNSKYVNSAYSMKKYYFMTNNVKIMLF